MFILCRYVLGNLRQRWVATTLTAFSVAVVTAILVVLLSMVDGIQKTVMSEGREDRFLALSKDSMSENQSAMDAGDPAFIDSMPEVKYDQHGLPQTSHETVATAKLKSGGGDMFPQVIRGVKLERACAVHDQLKILDGRLFSPNALNEIIIGKGAAQLLGLRVGDRLVLRNKDFRVVGIFSNNRAPSESEIWMSRENMEMHFRKSVVSSVWGCVKDKALTEDFVARLNKDNRAQVFACTEKEYFGQGVKLARTYQALGWFVATFLAVGAVFSAMNTMYASLGNRIKELSTLRAIGFSKVVIFQATLLEAVVISLIGGMTATLLTAFIDGLPLTMNITGIGKVVYEVNTTVAIRITGLVFSAALGFFGGLLPSLSSMEIGIAEGLKS